MQASPVQAPLTPGRGTDLTAFWSVPDRAAPAWIYTNRRLVENLWAHLKEWRAAATRSEKTARSLLGVLCLAATANRLKS